MKIKIKCSKRQAKFLKAAAWFNDAIDVALSLKAETLLKEFLDELGISRDKGAGK